jgi:hypothetical protein
VIKSFIACVVGVAGAVGLASPAAAWPWNAHVHATGLAYCGGTVPAARITIRTSTETRSAAVNSVGYYAIDFAKVPDRRQAASAHVTCALTGPRTYHRKVTVVRPPVGTWLPLVILRG